MVNLKLNTRLLLYLEKISKKIKKISYLIYGKRLGHLSQFEPQPLNSERFSQYRRDLYSAPKLSIVIPSLNQGVFIEQTIKSILNQNYPNLELIIQDGGSTDGTLKVISSYLSQISNFESVKDNGQSNAINQGFAKTTGDILAWINSDDVYLPHAFNNVISYFEEFPKVDD